MSLEKWDSHHFPFSVSTCNILDGCILYCDNKSLILSCRVIAGPRQHVRRLLQVTGGGQAGEEDPDSQPSV